MYKWVKCYIYTISGIKIINTQLLAIFFLEELLAILFYSILQLINNYQFPTNISKIYNNLKSWGPLFCETFGSINHINNLDLVSLHKIFKTLSIRILSFKILNKYWFLYSIDLNSPHTSRIWILCGRKQYNFHVVLDLNY
jgi:hypothetical protein